MGKPTNRLLNMPPDGEPTPLYKASQFNEN